MWKTFLAACAAALLIGACSKGPTRPIADGYTLHGVVTARDGAPLRDVSVFKSRYSPTPGPPLNVRLRAA